MATPLTPTSDSDRTDVVDPRDAAWIKLTQFDWEGTRSGADSATRVSVSALVGSVFRPAQGPHELGRLANFRILDILGQGGMGLVFRAEDVQLQREVALKILLPASMRDPQARERFLREARAAAGLSHDHVVAIHQVGEDQGVLFLAMSLLRGQSLEEWQRRQGPASWPRVFRLGRELLSGLAAAHAQGLVHRDVKPGNLWLEEPRGRLKILDFGLAWNASAMASTTQEGVRVGTPEYMSPEQMGGSPVDARSDLFAAGLVLHRLATGRLPFAGKTLFERMAAMASQGSPSVREQRPDAPPELDQFIRKLLELDPERRPAHAGEALAEWVAIETGWLTRQQELGTSAESLRQAAEVPVGAARPGVVPDPLPASTHESRSLHGPRRRVALLLGAAGIVAVLAILGFLTVPQWLADRASVASVTTPTPTSAEPAEAADEPAGRRRPRPGDGLPEQEARFERLGRCPDARVTEASALIASRRQAGLYWTLTDANNPPHVFALDLTGDLRGAYVLEGSVNVDWEAMTADRAGHLYIGDVGNNHMRQRTRVVYQLREPDLPTEPPQTTTLPTPVPMVARFGFTSERVFDSETLFFHQGQLFMISKEREPGRTELYRLPLDQPGGERPLERITTLAPELMLIADGAVSPDGRRLALVCRHFAAIYDLPPGPDLEPLGQARPRLHRFELFKIEGCDWEDDQHLIMIGEDRQLYRLRVD